MHYNSIRIGLFFIYTTKIVTCDASKYIMGLINYLGSECMDDSIKNYVIHFSELLNVLFTCLFTKNEYYLYLKKIFSTSLSFSEPTFRLPCKLCLSCNCYVAWFVGFESIHVLKDIIYDT